MNAITLHQASAESKKIVGVFYKANEYASANPSFLGCAENALGIREWPESKGHQYIVTDDKEGPVCELEKQIPDLHVLISTPFHPAYVTAERIKKAKNLQLLLTAGIGSDHIDLNAVAAAGLIVADVTGSNDKAKEFSGEISKAEHTMQSLDKTISNLEMELAAARVVQDSILTGIPIFGDLSVTEPTKRRKYLMVIGISTAFSSRKRIDYVRATWMQQGEKLKKLEDEKGIIMRFVIGHSATSGGILDRAIEAEEQKHGDFLRMDHVEGYLELSTKTKIYFATVVALWDADFYVKVDDDVHVNIGKDLARHIILAS
ncbi:hypothetical protein POM88_000944 [Heracleum sosnowskyi]|uniref:Hexosyltransferase n=1 Tax=Heracleum sosnowskyi TaxID=360622 RepID=A0AAD8JD46_9APIA|nr:hypothetical protein POM88_000944 [Heracleum sosnowskyi]